MTAQETIFNLDRRQFRFKELQEFFVSFIVKDRQTGELSELKTEIIKAYSKLEASNKLQEKYGRRNNIFLDTPLDFKLTVAELNFKTLIDELEEDNADTERCIAIATYLKDDTYKEIFKALGIIRKAENGYTNYLSKYKYDKYCEMRVEYIEDTIRLGF